MVHDYFLLVWCRKMLWVSSYTLFMICKKQGVFTINDVRKIIVIMCKKRVGGGGDAVTLMNTDTTLLSIFIGE